MHTFCKAGLWAAAAQLTWKTINGERRSNNNNRNNNNSASQLGLVDRLDGGRWRRAENWIHLTEGWPKFTG